jgi:hypothetical protein
MSSFTLRLLCQANQQSLTRLAVCCAVLSSTPALAQDPPLHADAPAETPTSAAVSSAEAGMLLPFSISPRTDSQRGLARALGGYDSARRRAQFEVVADVTVIGPVAVRLGALYGQQRDTFRPTLGLRVQALSQERQGIDLGVGAFYKPEGFTEPEGEIEVMVMVARRFGRVAAFANIVYGQDPEGNERDGELRLAALYAVTTPLQVGLDARLRFDLGGEEEKRREEGEAEYDVLVGPSASYAFGAVAAIAQAGLSVYGASPARPGALALLGVAGAL